MRSTDTPPAGAPAGVPSTPDPAPRWRQALALLACLLPLLVQAQPVAEDFDTSLATRVEASLVGHRARGIHVQARGAEVMLSGFVASQADGQAALEAAMAVEGVGAVHDQLFVSDTGRTPEAAVRDGMVASEVKAALAEAQDAAAFQLHVHVHDGVVLLSGFVDSAEIAARALRVAGDVSGVQRVIDGTAVPVD